MRAHLEDEAVRLRAAAAVAERRAGEHQARAQAFEGEVQSLTVELQRMRDAQHRQVTSVQIGAEAAENVLKEREQALIAREADMQDLLREKEAVAMEARARLEYERSQFEQDVAGTRVALRATQERLEAAEALHRAERRELAAEGEEHQRMKSRLQTVESSLLDSQTLCEEKNRRVAEAKQEAEREVSDVQKQMDDMTKKHAEMEQEMAALLEELARLRGRGSPTWTSPGGNKGQLRGIGNAEENLPGNEVERLSEWDFKILEGRLRMLSEALHQSEIERERSKHEAEALRAAIREAEQKRQTQDVLTGDLRWLEAVNASHTTDVASRQSQRVEGMLAGLANPNADPNRRFERSISPSSSPSGRRVWKGWPDVLDTTQAADTIRRDFGAMDVNGDGMVSLEEFRAASASRGNSMTPASHAASAPPGFAQGALGTPMSPLLYDARTPGGTQSFVSERDFDSALTVMRDSPSNSTSYSPHPHARSVPHLPMKTFPEGASDQPRLRTAEVKAEYAKFKSWAKENLGGPQVDRMTGAEMKLSLRNVLMSATMTHAVDEVLEGKLDQTVTEETADQVKAAILGLKLKVNLKPETLQRLQAAMASELSHSVGKSPSRAEQSYVSKTPPGQS